MRGSQMKYSAVAVGAVAMVVALGPAKAQDVAARPPSAATFAPIEWSGVQPGEPQYERLAKATRDLAKERDALVALLADRTKADAAKEPGVDVLLDLTEALTSYAEYLNRPAPILAPQWQTIAGKSLDRIHGMRAEFMPAREDARLTFHRRGGAWYGPRIGMVSTKFGESYHLQGCDASGLRADDTGIHGGFTLTSACGDPRYDMHFSGEHCGAHMPEFRNHAVMGHAFWPDWWAGPRERLRPWEQRFSLGPTRRCGWILDVTMLSEKTTPDASAVRGGIYAWIEQGVVRRGYVSNLRDHDPKGNNPETALSLAGWSLKSKSLEAEIHAGQKQAFRLRCALASSEAGALSGTVHTGDGAEAHDWQVRGTLYLAYLGTYDTEGLDGRWTQEALVGVAPATEEAFRWPDLPDAVLAADLFSRGLELYRHVAAVDMALREYPLPAAGAMQAVREGIDDRWRYWHPGSWDVWRGWNRLASPSGDMNLAAAAAAGNGAAGAVDYVEALLRTSRQAVADHKARAITAAGVSAAADPEFAPGPSAKRMEGDPARGNLLPAASSDGRDWRLFGDWTCFGFVPRGYSFETAPYLPELMVAPGLSSGGKAVRIVHPDPKVHLWCWRADPDLSDGAVTIPLEPLREEGTERDNWGHVAEKAPAGLRYLDGVLGTYATWYATTRLHAEVACRAWMAVRMNWDGRLWVNGSLIWRPARIHTPDRLAVVPVELRAGENRITVCVSPQPTSDGNSGKQGPWIYKYGERSYGSFALWVSSGGGPRPAAEVAGAAEAQASADRRRAQQVAARGIRGRRGDGSGRYPDAKPPLAWDLEKGINVRWKAALPTDDAEAVIVGDPAGDGAGRLFVTTYKGELACLDAATGKELWRRTPEVSGDLPPYPAPAVAASFAPARRWKAGGTGRQGFPETLSADFPAYARSCLTPVAGGRRVWMHDPRGRVACFDHDGRQAWAVAVPAQVPRFVCGGYVEYRVVPPTPPAMVGSRLVAAVGRGLAAFDADKGTELWRRDPLDYNGHFAVMDFGDGPRQQLVLLSSCEVLDAATGETLIPRCAPLMPDSTCQPVVEGRVAYFNACSSAVRFWTDGRGDLRHQVLWDSPTDVRKRRADQNAGRFNGKADPDFFGQSTGAFPPTPVLYDGLLFVHLAELNSIDHGPQNSLRLQTYDAATGCAVAQRYALVMNGMRPGSSAVVAGGYLFMADEGSEIAGHYPDFPKGVPMIAVATAEDQPRRIAQSRGLATLAPPVFDGRRIYLAGSDQVVCIERPEALGDTFSEYELAALKTGFFSREIGPRPGRAGELTVAPPADLAAGRDVPVAPLVSGQTPGRWLFAGPFAVDEKADVFSEQGGAGKVYPRAGQKVAYTAADGSRAEATFVLLEGPSAPSKDRGAGSKNPLIDATYAAALGNARLEGGVNFAVASGRKYNTTCYAYAVLDVTQAGRYRVETIVGRIKDSDIYLAGERLDHEMVVTLSRGRYPLIVRAALGSCQSHEAIEWAIQFRALPAGEPAPPPRPIAGSVPAGVRAPVAPLRIGGGVSPLLAARATTAPVLIGDGLPPVLLGVWPLPAEGRDDPGAAVAALPGGLAGEGSMVTLDGVKAEFRAVPAEAVVGAGGITDRHTFNVAQPTAGYGLDLKALFGDAPPARGLFFAVLENRRAVTVEVTCPSHARCWLSGREIRDAETVRLAPGLYPFLLECRATGEAKGKPAALAFSEVADPRLAAQRWLARVRRNEALLRAIAESGPAGAYAQDALTALRSEP